MSVNYKLSFASRVDLARSYSHLQVLGQAVMGAALAESGIVTLDLSRCIIGEDVVTELTRFPKMATIAKIDVRQNARIGAEEVRVLRAVFSDKAVELLADND